MNEVAHDGHRGKKGKKDPGENWHWSGKQITNIIYIT